MPSASDLVVGLGQVTVEMLGVGPRSPEAVVELATFSIQTGGAVGTTLATVAALGGRARYFGRLSDDEFGSIILRGLKEFGVDVSQVLIEPGKVSPASFVLVDERTGRRLVRFTRGSTTPIDPGELPRNLFDDARILLVDGRNPATEIAAAESAKALGVTVLLDARRLGAGMGELLDLSDIVIGNERFAAEFSHSSDMKRSLARADADGAEDRGHHAGRGGGDRPRGRDAGAPAGAADRGLRHHRRQRGVPGRLHLRSRSRGGRSTAACRSPTPPPRSTAGTWAAPAASRRSPKSRAPPASRPEARRPAAPDCLEPQVRDVGAH